MIIAAQGIVLRAIQMRSTSFIPIFSSKQTDNHLKIPLVLRAVLHVTTHSPQHSRMLLVSKNLYSHRRLRVTFGATLKPPAVCSFLVHNTFSWLLMYLKLDKRWWIANYPFPRNCVPRS